MVIFQTASASWDCFRIPDCSFLTKESTIYADAPNNKCAENYTETSF